MSPPISYKIFTEFINVCQLMWYLEHVDLFYENDRITFLYLHYIASINCLVLLTRNPNEYNNKS